ncbi:MAG: class I SAM-dependent methyltransferase [Arenicella sp.]|jgi:ubiquinone/menaquinone biosynthesis C-methylase UbiE|nr:class I SAM-dependent methyltransferase [Arenicella sp.]
MNFYDERILPHVINCTCGMKAIERQRGKVVPLAKGDVLEIGMGSGLNLKYYNPDKVSKVWGLEPSLGMQRKAEKNLNESPVPVEWLVAGCEAIPLPDDSIDTVMLTYVLCTIPDWETALNEIRRVLKPTGTLVFCEHGEAPEPNVRKWQNRINPMWKKIAGGCNLNRPIPKMLTDGGFSIDDLQQHHVPGPKIATYQYYGTCR